jgi:hypothetical protein
LAEDVVSEPEDKIVARKLGQLAGKKFREGEN